MNTLQEILNHGIDEVNAQNMINDYSSKIGTMNGIYEIMDITYDFEDKARVVTLKCSGCGRIIVRSVVRDKNKWCELIKTCPCQKNKKEKQIFKKNPKIKKPVCKKHTEPLIKYDDSYIGKKNNYLKVVGIDRRPSNNRKMFLCECDCGLLKLVEPYQWENGIVKSCGCKRAELNSNNAKTHGCSGDRLYHVWQGMICRCENSKIDNYRNYGGRGISVCKEWREDFTVFKKWAIEHGYDYNAPFGLCTIDRIDVNGNYEPSNCRWADVKTQANNKRPQEEWRKRVKKSWTIDGVTMSRSEWCKLYGMEEMTVKYRINHKGMTVLEALTTPKEAEGRPRK